MCRELSWLAFDTNMTQRTVVGIGNDSLVGTLRKEPVKLTLRKELVKLCIFLGWVTKVLWKPTKS